MKTLIVFDSLYGNTEKIAQAIASGLTGDVRVQAVSQTISLALIAPDIFIVGSPTHGGRPTPAMQAFLQKLPTGSLRGLPVAAFDTRFAPEDQGFGLRLVMRVIRFAAQRIAKTLKSKGADLVVPPEGFIVEDKEGPIKDGELERAKEWGKKIGESKTE